MASLWASPVAVPWFVVFFWIQLLAMLQATIDMKLAPAVVLHAFGQIEGWSTWYPGVIQAGWVQGEPWQPGAVMTVQVKNSLGMTVGSTATVLPDAEGKLSWENRAPGLITVCQAWSEATPNGCCFTLQKVYHGPAAPLLQLFKARQQRLVDTGLMNLRHQLHLAYDTARM